MWEGIEYISFSGAGTRGASYLGVYSALENLTNYNEKKKNLKGFAGTSIGSLCALCLLIGLKSSEMIDLLSPIVSSFDNIAPVFDISLMISNYGLDTGNTMKNAIKLVLNKAGLSETITLQHLSTFFPAKFICVSTNLTSMTHEFISSSTFPNLQVVDAVFMSMCVPFLFVPAELNNDLYIDGALSMNIPQCFEASKTLCFIVNSDLDKSIASWPAYIHRLFICRTMNQDILFEEYGCNNVLKIQMNEMDSDAMDLHINKSTVKRLIITGYISALTFIYPNLMETMENILKIVVALHVQVDAQLDDDEKMISF